MADTRIITFKVPISASTTHFQVQFSNDRREWTTLKVSGVSDIPVASLSDRAYTLDGVNSAADSATHNVQEASTPPMWYRLRLKATSTYGNWLAPFVVSSPEDFIEAVKRQLKDPSLNGNTELLSEQDYLLHLAQAVSAFEKRHPYTASQVYALTDDTQEYDLPDDWSYGFSFVTQVEYPTGSDPRRYVHADYVIPDEATATWRFREIYPDSGESVRLYFRSRHGQDGSTVPAHFFNSVVLWAAGDAAMQLRSKSNQFGDLMIGADYVQIDPRIKEWGKIASEWKAQAEAMWGQGGSGVRTHLIAYDDHGRIPGRVTGW